MNIQIHMVHALLKGLEKIAASADIPMLVCGDFNSVPGRYVVYFSTHQELYWYNHLNYKKNPSIFMESRSFIVQI